MRIYTTPAVADRGAISLRTNDTAFPTSARELIDPDFFKVCD